MSDHDRTPQHKHCAEGWICEKHLAAIAAR